MEIKKVLKEDLEKLIPSFKKAFNESEWNQRWTDKVESRIKEMKYGDKIWQVIRNETGGLDQLQTVIEVNGISSLTGFVSDKLRLW